MLMLSEAFTGISDELTVPPDMQYHSTDQFPVHPLQDARSSGIKSDG